MSIQSAILKNSMYMFLNGSGGVCQVDLEANQVVSLPQEISSMTLINLSVNLTKYFVDATNNTFGLNGVMYSIPIGTYTYNEIALEINALLTAAQPVVPPVPPATTSVITPVVAVVYDPNTNQFNFTFATSTSLTFVNRSYYTLGFLSTDTPSGTSFTSTQILDAWQGVKCCFIRVKGVSHFVNGNISNFTGNMGQTEITDILTMIPINEVNPFCTLHYINMSNNYEMFFTENKIDQLVFTFTDEYNNVLTYLNNFTLGIKINTYAYDNSQERLLNGVLSIFNYLKMMFLSYSLYKKR